MKISDLCKKIKITDDRGFTLIEAMMATLLFTGGMIAVTVLTTEAVNRHGESRQSISESNRTVRNLETIYQTSSKNDNVLEDGGMFKAPGASNIHIGFTVQDNAVVSGTKLIVMQNSQVGRNGNSQPFILNLVKPEIN